MNYYFDTTVFTEYFENKLKHKKDVEDIISGISKNNGIIFTSILTLHELLCGLHAQNKTVEIESYTEALNRISKIIPIDPFISDFSAQLMVKKYGSEMTLNTPPKLKHFRWDALHIATAKHVNANKIFTYDSWNSWQTFIPEIKIIVNPTSETAGEQTSFA